MININRVLKDDRLMRATIGLPITGFENLVDEFTKSYWDIKEKQYQKGIKNRTRKRKPGGGRKGNLANVELKLFFILLYFKCYPTMDLTGLMFGLDRFNVKHSVDNLTPVLERTLGRTLSLPKRKIRTLEEFIELIPEAKDC